MAAVTEVIKRLGARGVTLRLEGTDGFRVIGVSKLTDQERAILKAYKPAILQALRQPAKAVNDCQGETVARAPRVKADPGAMTTRVKNGWYAPNCNRCRQYHWRSATCQRQGRVEFANAPLCGGQDYQPFAPTLAEREALTGVTGESAS
jgi:hypothetical protein